MQQQLIRGKYWASVIMMCIALSATKLSAETHSDVVEQASDSIATDVTQKQVTFHIDEYRVRGNTLLEKLQIELVLYPYLGENKSIKEIESARQALESRYRQAGYPTVLVNIPEQDINNGVVYLYVTEAKINQLKISGSEYFSLQRIREEIPSVSEGKVLYLPAFQEQLASVNSTTPDRILTPVLKPGKIPGTVDVELKVSDRSPLHGSLGVDNRHSSTTSKLRANATIRYDNLWQKEHSITLQYQTSPKKTDEVQVVSGVYLARPTDSRNLYIYSAIHSNSDVATLAGTTVVGKGDTFGFSSITPLVSSADSSHSIKLDVNYKDLTENVITDGVVTSQAPLEYVSLGGQYTGTFRTDSSNWQFNAGFTMGVQALNEKRIECLGEKDQFQCRRDGSKPNFIHMNLGVVYKKYLPADYSFNFLLNGQIADTPLISNEQISAGGASTVRGYFESERFGDDGVIGALELQSPSIAKLLPESVKDELNDLYYLLFIDRAWLRMRNVLPGTEPEWQLRSAGFGLRIQAFKVLIAELDWAKAYKDSQSPVETSTPNVLNGDSRVHFKIEYAF